MTEQAGGVEVVRADDSNWQDYREIRLAALRGAPRAYWTTYDDAAERTDEQWRELVTGSRIWLALSEGVVVGTVGSFRPEELPEGDCILVGMWVDPQARGRGVGELLVRTVLDDAAARGLTRVLLEVAHENALAAGLYERMGFVATGRTGAMPHDPSITEYEMERVLG